MKSQEWKTYRTRFLVKAKQLTSTLSFTDHLGRQHCGRKGDYLVESFEGVISIAPRHIFQDIYVPMPLQDGSTGSDSETQSGLDESNGGNEITSHLIDSEIQQLKVERIRDAKFGFASSDSLHKQTAVPGRGRRKSPQPVRDPATRMGAHVKTQSFHAGRFQS
jgi:hypothetical protein